MGNYHMYELKSKELNLEDIPKVYFEDDDALEFLVCDRWTQRKRWNFSEDMVRLSEVLKDILFIVVETDEDETILREHQFLGGVHKWVDGRIVFPEIDWCSHEK